MGPMDQYIHTAVCVRRNGLCVRRNGDHRISINMRTPQFMLHDAPKLLRERVSSYQTSQQGGDDAIIIREPLREETFDSVPSAINITDA